MADSINIMTSGSHANVATEYRGVTPILAGYDGGRVPLHLQQKGDSIDVSEYSTLRVLLQIPAMGNRYGAGRETEARLYVTIEHSPDGLTWAELHTFEPAAHGSSFRKVLTNFENFVRASWWFSRPGFPAETIKNDVTVTWALSADALPEAA